MLQYLMTLVAVRRGDVVDSNDKGASAVEYGLLVAAIAALIVLIVFALGGVVKEAFTDTCDAITSGNTSISASC